MPCLKGGDVYAAMHVQYNKCWTVSITRQDIVAGGLAHTGLTNNAIFWKVEIMSRWIKWRRELLKQCNKLIAQYHNLGFLPQTVKDCNNCESWREKPKLVICPVAKWCDVNTQICPAKNPHTEVNNCTKTGSRCSQNIHLTIKCIPVRSKWKKMPQN